VAINLDTDEGQALKNLAELLHDRRTGRCGRQRWSLEAAAGGSKLRPGLDLLDDYRRGDPPLSNVNTGWKPYIRAFIRTGRLNIADLLISSTRNRMGLRGFRTAAANDELGDAKAAEIMRANGLKVVSRDVHDMLLTFGDSYTITTPPRSSKGETKSLITAEDPRQVITVDDPLTMRPKWGLKAFRDDWDSEDLAYLFLPDGAVRVARRKGQSSFTSGRFRFDDKNWSWDDKLSQDSVRGLFPITHFQNERGVGEFEEHLDTLNRINDKIFNEWWIGKIQAFRQRAVKNLPDTDEETGEEIDYTDMFTASPDEMWQVPADVDFWESAAIDVTPIVTSIQKDLERLAAAKSQPLHTITPDAANGSAEGASLMREEHLYKVEDRLDRVGHPWALTLAKAFAFQGDTDRADASQIEAIWGPLERFSLGQKADAANKLDGILPTEAIYTDILQYPPAEVPNLRALRGRDLLFRIQNGGQTAPTPPAPAPAPGA
jgi:hypothetical protein